MGALSGLTALSAVFGTLPLQSETMETGLWEPIPGGTQYFRLIDGSLQSTSGMSGIVNYLMSSVLEAFICVQESKVYAKLLNGMYISFESLSIDWGSEEENDYLYRKSFPDSIPLR
jgi:hypothetical protein